MMWTVPDVEIGPKPIGSLLRPPAATYPVQALIANGQAYFTEAGRRDL